MFAAFGDNRLDRVDSTTPALRLAEWKASEKTRKHIVNFFPIMICFQKSDMAYLNSTERKNYQRCTARMFFRSVIFF